MAALYWARNVILRHAVTSTGPELMGSEAIGSLLGIRCVRIAKRLLQLWQDMLRERSLLKDYSRQTEPNCGDPFPEVMLVAHFGDPDGPLLRSPKTFSLHTVDKKTLYRNCVKVLNRRGLSPKSASVWTDRLGGDGACPCWRVLVENLT